MAAITLVIPIRNEADISFFDIEGADVELSIEKVKKLSGIEVAEAIILSLGGSVTYDAGKAAIQSLASRIRDYFTPSNGEEPAETIISFNGVQYDVSDKDDLEALVADLNTVTEARDADSK